MAKVIHNVVGLIGLLIAFSATQTGAIRVYWNTNTGPIVPPTTTPVPVPQPPFRDPAPVWEKQSDDVPNPNPYVYILPPPSRPKYNEIPVRRQQASQQQTQTAQSSTVAPATSSTLAPTGKVIEKPEQNKQTPAANNSHNHQPSSVATQESQRRQQQQQHIVPSLAVQYVPNQGFKYYAVVLVHSENPSKSAYLKTNDVQLGKYDQYDKPSGRYNAKLKKYKAFEKVKYVPYYMYFDVPKQQYVLSSVPPKAVHNVNNNGSPNHL